MSVRGSGLRFCVQMVLQLSGRRERRTVLGVLAISFSLSEGLWVSGVSLGFFPGL